MATSSSLSRTELRERQLVVALIDGSYATVKKFYRELEFIGLSLRIRSSTNLN